MSMHSEQANQHAYPRRVLLAVLGTSPQVITETIYGLINSKPSFTPTEIILVTTLSGAATAKRLLLDSQPPVLEQMAEDYQWPKIRFDEKSIHIIQTPDGNLLEDIRSLDDNQYLADYLTNLIREITSDNNSTLHVSIAGGRKSMSFFAGYILTLFGRPRDRLSHVLVDETLINTDFFYPRPGSTIDISLAYIPFVPLRSGMNDLILTGNKGFTETINVMRRAERNKPLLIIDRQQLCIQANGEQIDLTPPNMAFVIMLAQRIIDDLPGYSRSDDDEEDKACASEYLEILATISNEWGDTRTQEAIQSSGKMVKADKDQRKTLINNALKQNLGEVLAQPYLVSHTQKNSRGLKLFGFNLPADQIRFEAISP